MEIFVYFKTIGSESVELILKILVKYITPRQNKVELDQVLLNSPVISHIQYDIQSRGGRIFIGKGILWQRSGQYVCRVDPQQMLGHMSMSVGQHEGG